VLDAWLGEKGNPYTKESLFRCDDACPRYGCRGELLVDVTLLELSAQARHLDRPVPEVTAGGRWWGQIREKIRALDTPGGLGTLLPGMEIVEALNL
jgi:hypothetical protein